MLPIGVTKQLNQPILANEKVFDVYECEKLIEIFKDLDNRNSPLIYNGKIGENNENDNAIRNVKVCDFDKVANTLQIPLLQEMNQKLMYAINVLNVNDYQFDLSHIDLIQVAEYTEGCHYDWHCDIPEISGNHCRKLSFTVLLNNASEYGGGVLHFNSEKNYDMMQKEWESMEAGSMIAFPSWMQHKVYPVTSGVRYQLFGWVCGPRWK